MTTTIIMARRANRDWTCEELTIQEWLAAARSNGQVDAYTGKREHLRHHWQVPVQIEVESDRVRRERFAYTRDISEGGLGIRCRDRLPVGALLTISCDGGSNWVRGRVQHCTSTLGGYLIGVTFVTDAGGQEAFARSA